MSKYFLIFSIIYAVSAVMAYKVSKADYDEQRSEMSDWIHNLSDILFITAILCPILNTYIVFVYSKHWVMVEIKIMSTGKKANEASRKLGFKSVRHMLKADKETFNKILDDHFNSVKKPKSEEDETK